MTVTVYVIRGEVGESDPPRSAFGSYEQASARAQRMPAFRIKPEGLRVEPLQWEWPDDVIPNGSTIAVELYRGGYQDDDGIHHGGAWEEIVGVAHADFIDLYIGKVNGHLTEISTDRFILNLSLKIGEQGYPYRNAQVLRNRTSREDGSF